MVKSIFDADMFNKWLYNHCLFGTEYGYTLLQTNKYPTRTKQKIKKLQNKIKAGCLLEQHKIMIKNLYKLNFIKKILWQQVF